MTTPEVDPQQEDGEQAVDPGLRREAEDVLRRLVGDESAAFRDGQLEAIAALVDGGRRVLVVQRTGWGKSAVYFVATALLRARGRGPTVIVSPLLALMRDQVAAAQRAGLTALTINSANADEWSAINAALAAGEVDLLLVSPERLNNPRFRDEQLPQLADAAGLLVVDEAHCISDWGHDFRPDYRRIRDLLVSMPVGRPVLATTATANQRVVDDVEEQLEAGGAEVRTYRGSLSRESLRLGVLPLPTPEARLGWLTTHLGELEGSGIVYALTVAAAEDTATMLRDSGHEVRAYTGRTDPADRLELELALRDNKVKALVATSALGMGFDKPDLGFVVHLGAPGVARRLLPAGRPGRPRHRAGRRAAAARARGPRDLALLRHGLHAAAGRRHRRHRRAAGVGESHVDSGTRDGGRRPAHPARAAAQGPRRRGSGAPGLRRLAGHGRPLGVRRRALRQGGRSPLGGSGVDARLPVGQTCRMRFLQQALDDPSAPDCGRCDVCAGAWYPTDVPDGAAAAAGRTLRRVGVEIDARSQWPSGMSRLGVPSRESWPPRSGSRTGRARCPAHRSRLGAAAAHACWRHQTPSGRRAAAQGVHRVLADWPWEQRPTAVVAVPSLRRPLLVDSVARHLADPRPAALPRLARLTTDEGTGSRAATARSGWPRCTRDSGCPPSWPAQLAALDGPVLLVDDLVDSRWTITVAGRALRLAGAPGVLPFALAVAA